MTDNDILDDMFLSCALAAFLDQAAIEQNWPDAEATRRRAYGYYEEVLAAKNIRHSSPVPSALTSPPKRDMIVR